MQKISPNASGIQDLRTCYSRHRKHISVEKLALLYDGKNLSYGFYFKKELCSCQVNEIALFFGLFVLFVLFLFFALKFASYRQSLSAYRKDIHTDFMLQMGQNNI